MKTKSIVLSLVLAFPLSVLSAAETSILLTGKTNKTGGRRVAVADGANALIKGAGDETKVSADEIAFDATKNVLVCSGDSIVSSGGRVFKAKDITIELGGSTARVYVLSPEGTPHLGEMPSSGASVRGAQFMPLFTERLPSVDLELNSRTRR